MKRKFLVATILAVIVVAVLSVAALSAGGYLNKPAVLVADNVAMQTENPFAYQIVWSGGGESFNRMGNDSLFSLFPGDEVAVGEINLTNISPNTYGVSFYSTAISVDGDIQPAFETLVKMNDRDYYSGQLTLTPGQTVNLKVKVTVSYGVLPSSLFHGVQIYIVPAPPLPSHELG